MVIYMCVLIKRYRGKKVNLKGSKILNSVAQRYLLLCTPCSNAVLIYVECTVCPFCNLRARTCMVMVHNKELVPRHLMIDVICSGLYVQCSKKLNEKNVSSLVGIL